MANENKASRLVLMAALAAGLSYLLAIAGEWAGPPIIAWKGAGVALLAVYAGMRARSLDGWLLTLVMAFGALGDVLIDAVGLTAGAAAFAAGHVTAIGLYSRNGRADLTASQRALSILAALLVPVISWLLTHDAMATFYAALLGAMAGSAWASRFPRFRTGLGAMMFVASDLLIFAREGAVLAGLWIGFAIWALYFMGQYMIATGVADTLARRAREQLL